MKVYIESNFVLELVFEQEQVEFAEEILQLAEGGFIEIFFPAFALIEPYWTITHRGKERKQVCNALNVQKQQLSRSNRHNEIVRALEPVTISMLNIEKLERENLERTAIRLSELGIAIEISGDTFVQSLAYQTRYGLSPQDAIIYSALISDLKERSPKELKCFVSKNSKDFFDPDIESELSTFNCKYLANFEAALQYIRDFGIRRSI